MKKQLTFISILMVIVIVALTLGGLQLFGSGKVKPSEWFGKSEKPQAEQSAPETASIARANLLAANSSDSDLLKTFVYNGKTYMDNHFSEWYEQAAPGLKYWDYTIKSSITCTDSACAMVNQNIIFSLSLEEEDYDCFDYSYVTTPSTAMGLKYNRSQVSDVPPHKFLHTHSTSAMLDSVIISITDSKFSISVEDAVSKNVSVIYTCAKGSDVYTKYYNLLLCNSDWRLNYTSGGTGAKTITKGNYAMTETMVLDSRTPVSLPADPTKEGHTFAGWYYGTQSEHESNCTPYAGEPIYADTALHAHFNINRYTVTYDANGGTEVNNETVDWNTAASTPLTERVGYNFIGWVLSDGSTYTNQPITANTKLTAKWEIKIFTVTFYVDGENGEEVFKTVDVPYGSTLVAAMEESQIASYRAMSTDGVRLSKQSVITEDASVLVNELTGWEKFGDYVGTHQWVTWLTVSLLGSLIIISAISITVAVKRK